jgi:hypothetical protein
VNREVEPECSLCAAFDEGGHYSRGHFDLKIYWCKCDKSSDFDHFGQGFRASVNKPSCKLAACLTSDFLRVQLHFRFMYYYVVLIVKARDKPSDGASPLRSEEPTAHRGSRG